MTKIIVHRDEIMQSFDSKLRVSLAGQLRGRILDCGCGKGLFHSHLNRGTNGVISLDIRKEALANLSGTRVAAHCARTPFVDDTFDAVWACAVLEHTTRPALAEWIRITRCGGRIVTITPNRHSPWDCINKLLGMRTWSDRPEHVRLYSVAELRFYGPVHGETRFLPFGAELFRRCPQISHVLVLDLKVTDELKRKVRRRFPQLYNAPPPQVAKIRIS